MTQKKTGNPQWNVRSPAKLRSLIEKKAKAKGLTPSRWLLSLAATECGYNHPLPARGSNKKGK